MKCANCPPFHRVCHTKREEHKRMGDGVEHRELVWRADHQRSIPLEQWVHSSGVAAPPVIACVFQASANHVRDLESPSLAFPFLSFALECGVGCARASTTRIINGSTKCETGGMGYG